MYYYKLCPGFAHSNSSSRFNFFNILFFLLNKAPACLSGSLLLTGPPSICRVPLINSGAAKQVAIYRQRPPVGFPTRPGRVTVDQKGPRCDAGFELKECRG